jgi:lipoprotein-anchoring transpeptidase ErfK/SrfK
MITIRTILAATAIAMLPSCVGTQSPTVGKTLYLQGIGVASSNPDPLGLDKVSYWDGDSASGAPSIRIKVGEQKAYFYKAGTLVGVSMISSGREDFNTPTGSYKIIEKNKNHKSNLYGEIVDAAGNVVVKEADIKKDRIPPGCHFEGAPMPYFMRVTGGVGMHVGFLPGYAASHGCIRMPEHMAVKFFNNVSVGTPVTIEY